MIYSFIYIVLTALSMILIHHIGQDIPPSISLFFSVLLTIVYFHAINLFHLKKIYQLAWQAKGSWLQLLLSVLILWSCTLYGPTYVTATLYILTFFGLNFSHFKQPWITGKSKY